MSKPCLLIAALLILFIALPAYSQPVPDEHVPDQLVPNEMDDEVDQGPCQVMPIRGGIHCVGEDGQRRWEIHYPSLWEDVEAYQAQVEEPRPVLTAVVAGRTFYAVRNDLLEVDTEAGVVISRRRMPARIFSLAPLQGDDERLAIVLRSRPSTAIDETFDVPMTYGLDAPPPSQNVWLGDTVEGRFNMRRDAAWLISRHEEEGDELVFEALVQAHERDPLNLFYLVHLTRPPHQARFLGDLDEDERDEALLAIWKEAIRPSNSAGLTGPPWQDMITVSWWLQKDPLNRMSAREVFSTGYQKMLDAGILPERITNLVPFVLLHMESPEVIEEAVASQDLALVEELSERLAMSAPLVEGGEFVWADLARWLEERGHPGQPWHERARDNKERSYNMAGSDARAADRYIALLAGITLALLVYPFMIGVQGGRHRRRDSNKKSERSRPFWRPVLKVRDLLGLVALLAALPVVGCLFAIQLTIIGTLADAPLNVFGDTFAAPEVQTWLEELAQSPPRDELLEIARAERKALEEGRVVMEKSPVSHLLRDAIAADARATQWKELRQGRMLDPFTLVEVDASARSDGLKSLPMLHFLPIFGLFAILILMGSLLGFMAPKASLWMIRIVPGAAPVLAPIGGLILAAFLASIVAFMGFDSVLSSLARPAFARYFGLIGIGYQEILPPSRQWAFVALVGAVILQALGAYLSTEKPTEMTEKPTER